MASIPIASLSPSEPPPADKSIRAIVSLLWPYSSSTKQCALLLAEPDFRLRNHKGQIRVRFQGASAQAVAKGQIGIGDEVVLELRGSSWAGESSNVVTPGKSVEGELLFRGELAVRLVKKADGPQADVISIHVNETTPPPEERDANTTPVRPIPSYLRSSLGGADVVPIYSSPAFVKRMRLSGGNTTSWDPFADVDRELEAELANPRKKQRISFGGTGQWRVADRTPSPEKEDAPMVTVVDTQQSDKVAATEDQDTSALAQDQHEAVQTNGAASSAPEVPSAETDTTSPVIMAPPPLPRLQMPESSPPPELSQGQQASSESGPGPHTPKLQPVPSSALPLPSPFPAEAKQLHMTSTSSTMILNEDQDASSAAGAVLNGKDAEAIERSGHVPLHTEASQDLLDAVEEEDDDDQRYHPVLPGQPSFSSSVASTVPPEQASGVFNDSGSGDDDNDSDNLQEAGHASRHQVPQPQYESDTEEDEEMYSQFAQQRDTEAQQAIRGRDESDHDDQIEADDVEEVIEDMGEPPECDDSDEDMSEASIEPEESDDEDVRDIDDKPRTQPTAIDVPPDSADASSDVQPASPRKEEALDVEQAGPNTLDAPAAAATSAGGDNTIRLSQVGNALSNTFGQQPQADTAAQSSTQTPLRPPPGLFSLDGAADSLKVRTSTPQSERDRIMKKTYSSLFGFAKSPSPEKTQPPTLDFGTPTPAASSTNLSRMAKDRFAAAGASVEQRSLEERPVPPRAHVEEARTPANVTTSSAVETPMVEQPVPARAAVADTQSSGIDAAMSESSTQAKQMPVPARAMVGDTQSLGSLPTASAPSTQAKQMPVPNRATVGNTQGSTAESGSEKDVETGGGTIPKSVMVDDAAGALEEPAAATEETGQTYPAGDVDDGSLLETVHNAAPKIHEEQEQDEVLIERSSVVQETPMDQLHEAQRQESREQGRLQAEDSVPDGVAINPGLAAALTSEADGAATTDGSGPALPASSAPRPSQVEVIDLGDSSDEEEEAPTGTTSVQETSIQPSQPSRPTTDDASTPTPGQHTADTAGAQATDRQQDFERLLSQAEAPRNHAQESVTQISQGSLLHSDMLDTTQTTVDGRSEIATPYMDEYDTIVPDTSHDEPMGVFQGQPNFFDDQMHGQEFEGNAAPQLTQRTALGDRYTQNLSFESATSIATDNSAHYPANTTQRDGVTETAQEDSLMRNDLRGNESQVTVLEAGSPSTSLANADLQAPSLLSAPIDETPQDQLMPDNAAPEHQIDESELRAEDLTHDVEMHDGELRSSFVGETYPQRQPDIVLGSSFECSQSAAVPSEDFSTDVKSLREAAQLAASQISQDDDAADQDLIPEESFSPAGELSQPEERSSSRHTGPQSLLPISPEDSQHRLESQPFETQLPFESVQSALPPTPQLTQGDSLTGQDLAVVVDPATEETDNRAEEPPPTSPRQTRSSQRAVLTDGLQSPEKKAPIRRSPRKSQIQSQEAQEEAKEDTPAAVLHKPITRQSSLDRPITPPPRTQRSQEKAATKNIMLSPKAKTPVRRSPRKAQIQDGSQDLADVRSVAGSQGEELAADRDSVEPFESAIVTRSSKKTAAKTLNSRQATQDLEDEVAVQSPSAKMDESPLPKTPARRSMTSRISAVPAVISNWFSPRRSTRLEPEADPEAEAEVEAEVQAGKDKFEPKPSPSRRKSTGVATALSYYTPLSNISEKLNASSQAYGSNTLDVMAVVVDETSKPQRAKSGPRDHFTIFKITDPSMDAGTSTSVEVFKHWHATLPSAQVGDVVLLRSFLVKSKKRQPYLLSGDESAWCVWRYGEDVPNPSMQSSQKGTPTKVKRMRDRNGSFSIEIKGPPVEYNRPQELQRAEELKAWWLEQGQQSADADADAAPASQASQGSTQSVGRKTRSQQKL